ncbi:uncharacterized protein [Drosophila bipectinata]|uniref:uncharacterized protein isoform X2 n=1 Tax=Drosophila bipectinata TaxID=42026 RepID=UPI0038B33E4B
MEFENGKLWKSMSERSLNLQQQLQQNYHLCHSETAALWDQSMSQLVAEKAAANYKHCPNPTKATTLEPCLPIEAGGSVLRLAVYLLVGLGVAFVGARLRHEMM